MSDMLVTLYKLPPLEDALVVTRRHGVTIRRALSPEKPRILAWAAEHFPGWVAEIDVAIGRLPVSCFIAVREQQILGFACHDATCRNFFGPEGVLDAVQGQGIGKALLLAALHAQRELGYAYAVIGSAGPKAFYEKSVGAVVIDGSSPGIYAGMLQLPSKS
jgi:GNAT superfamily N-acetyltransferase